MQRSVRRAQDNHGLHLRDQSRPISANGRTAAAPPQMPFPLDGFCAAATVGCGACVGAEVAVGAAAMAVGPGGTGVEISVGATVGVTDTGVEFKVGLGVSVGVGGTGVDVGIG